MVHIELGWVGQTLTQIEPKPNGMWPDRGEPKWVLACFPTLVNVIVFVSFHVFVPFIDIGWI